MKKILLLLLTVAALISSSCKKEEVQANDIIGKWTVKEAFSNGVSQNVSGSTFTIDYKKDKTYETYTNTAGTSQTQSGTYSIPAADKIYMSSGHGIIGTVEVEFCGLPSTSLSV